MLSILILTKNESINIANAIDSVKWSDDIVVYDSHSTDDTCEIAERLGARIVAREFDNWSSHQNWAVRNIVFKHPWVLYIDADEFCDSELKDAALKLCCQESPFDAFRVKRKDFFMGRWLRRSQLYPTWLVRVFRPTKITYERLVNPVAVVRGLTGNLEGHIIHHPFSHGVSHWFERHNKYSTFEAKDLLAEATVRIHWRNLVSRDANVRRKTLKLLAYRLPARPTMMFLYLFFFRLGFLDGIPGFYYSRMRSMYELMIDVKVREKSFQSKQSIR